MEISDTNGDTASGRKLSRRDAIKWMMMASATMMFSAEGATRSAASPFGLGYGLDPDLNKIYRAGDYWPLTLTAAQRRTVVALCDLIIPADDFSPSASAVGVPDFIDEWISAPYPAQKADAGIILDGLVWLDAEARRRGGKDFAGLEERDKSRIADDICYLPDAKPNFELGARFFKKFRDLTAGGFYTLPEGMRDIGYVGNVPSLSFAGPPIALIRKLGLA
jgi:hypothetical protein